MKLTEHFTLEELIASDTAARLQIDNTPNEYEINNLRSVAELLEKVRGIFGLPIVISSGYRCSKLNKMVGSKPSSKHTMGLAVDFRVYGKTPLEVCEAIARAKLQYDQCILEFYNPSTGSGWTHLGLSSSPRYQNLTINPHGTFTGFHV